MKRHRLHAAVILSAAGLCVSLAAAQSQPEQVQLAGAAAPQEPTARELTVFSPAQAPADATPLKHTRATVAVAPNFNQFALASTGDILLFPNDLGEPLKLLVDRVEKRATDRYSIFGTVQGAPMSSFILVIEVDAVVGDIRLPSALLHFRPKNVGNGTVLICNIDDSQYGKCGGTDDNAPPFVPIDPVPESIELDGIDPRNLPQTPDGGFNTRGTCSAPQNVFDVMIAYTDLARAGAGGTTAIQGECQLAVDTTNQAYLQSNIDARMRLVWRGEVTYNESGTFYNHRDRLRDGSDGVYDNLVTLKDTYNADFCSLLLNEDDGGTLCGLAYCGGAEADAFMVCNWECASGNFSYPHEHAHNQGCAHDPPNAGSGCNSDSFSFGHSWTSTNGNRYRSIMCYNDDSNPSQRIGYFSNPDINFIGVATGTATRNNARTIRDRRGTYENWELTRLDVWVDFSNAFIEIGTFSFPYNTVTEGVAQIQAPGPGNSESPNLYIKEGTTNWTGTINKEMTIRACGGIATIGQQ